MSTAMGPNDGDTQTAPSKTMKIEEHFNPGYLRRLSTALRSFWVLKDLSPEQVDNFMKSYVIYDLDWADEKMMVETLGPDYQKKVGECLGDYYSVLNHLCAMGELEKMYIPPIMDLQADIFTNQILYEESIAEELKLPENPRLLDLGCGRGRVAAHMTRLCGARVTGINIDHDQVASAVAYNEENGYSNEFIRRDFNELPLPLPDAEFDGFYQIQAFSLCKNIPKLCAELFRVLKPGAHLSLLDWASLDAFDPKDEHHKKLMRQIKPLIGAVGTPTPKSLAKDLESAGFRVLRMNNASIDGLQAPLIERAERYFRTAKYAILTLVRFGILPAHFKTLLDRFTLDGEAFIEADRSRLITTSYHWVAYKPKEGEDLPLGTQLEGGLTADLLAVVDAVDRSASTSSSERADGILSSTNSESTAITDPSPSSEVAPKTEMPSSTAGVAAVQA